MKYLKIIISIVVAVIVAVTLAIYLVITQRSSAPLFTFCNDHIDIPCFDITMEPRYNSEEHNLLLLLVQSFEDLSNATEDDLIHDMGIYEFTAIPFNDVSDMVYMKTFNGIPTNDWYWFILGSWIKSYETITNEMAWEFLQDPQNDPRNFDVSQVEFPRLDDREIVTSKDYEYRIVLHNGNLYPLVSIWWRFYDSDGFSRGVSKIVNTATGGHYNIDDFPNFDPRLPW